MSDIYFWQRIVSPHMAHLAAALARQGCQVTYVAEQEMSAARQQQGWDTPQLDGVTLVYADSHAAIQHLAEKAGPGSMHICQGIRSNGLVAMAQRELSARSLRQWVVMETVEDSGWRGFLKRMEYSRLFHLHRNSLQGVLAIGHNTADWVAARGLPADHVFPFAYFLPTAKIAMDPTEREPGTFRFVFAGRLIPLKRIDWLIEALATAREQNFELVIVGSGTEEPALRALAVSKLGGRVRWLGRLPLDDVPAVMAGADCLVLPSLHDGWGAVISESLMVGTPVICSDACGAAGVVHASRVGGVFPKDRIDILRTMLNEQIKAGPIDQSGRTRLSAWATALGADAGAHYLLNILNYSNNNGKRPTPPWRPFRC